MRVCLVARRFWPLVGSLANQAFDLAAELARQGVDVTVVTPRVYVHWPREAQFDGFRVVRLPQPRGRLWTQWRYASALSSWLKENRQRFDLAYVLGLRYDAQATLSAADRVGLPVVLRAAGSGPRGDLDWQARASGGGRVRKACQMARWIVAPTLTALRELQAAGFADAALHRIDDGIQLPTLEHRPFQAQCRGALAHALGDLHLPARARLVVVGDRLKRTHGTQQLLSCWHRVLALQPDAALWIIGDGPERDTLLTQVRQLGLTGRVAIAGPVDTMDEALLAADLVCVPNLAGGPSRLILEAMSLGQPIAAQQTPANEDWLAHDHNAWLLPLDDPISWAMDIAGLLGDPARLRRLGQTARQDCAERFAIEPHTRRLTALFDDVLRGCVNGRCRSLQEFGPKERVSQLPTAAAPDSEDRARLTDRPPA
jgi:glycosyltransferase involved in cell wall biosynthesis